MAETRKTVQVKEAVKELLTEYKNVPVVCTKCGDKIRTNKDNKVYCPNEEKDCPLIQL